MLVHRSVSKRVAMASGLFVMMIVTGTIMLAYGHSYFPDMDMWTVTVADEPDDSSAIMRVGSSLPLLQLDSRQHLDGFPMPLSGPACTEMAMGFR